MPIVSREVGDVLILDVSGRLSLGEGSYNLRDVIGEAVRNGKKRVLLNLAETVYVDSSGLGEMVIGFTTLANQGAKLKLLAPTKRIEDLLYMVKLHTLFDIYKTEEEAVRSFS